MTTVEVHLTTGGVVIGTCLSGVAEVLDLLESPMIALPFTDGRLVAVPAARVDFIEITEAA